MKIRMPAQTASHAAPQSTLASRRLGVAVGIALFLGASPLLHAQMADQAHNQTAASTAAAVADQPQIGEVSLVLGRAWLETLDARGVVQRVAVQSGVAIRESDRVVTESNGHVHIRFVDDALVSVRPDSRLEVARYRYNPEYPQQSAIRLNLEEGVTRSISGQGASAARERFRLNTPIAAIGVRGTDFVVSASAGSVRAQVNEGAIVMAPFSSECSADAFGPCLANAVELTDSALYIAEMDGGGAAPRLMTAQLDSDSDQILRSEPEAANVATDETADEKTSTLSLVLENVTSRHVTAAAQDAINRPAPITPEIAWAPSEAREREMTWGRFGDGAGSLERISVASTVARPDRETTVGGNGYALYRDQPGRAPDVRNMGAVSFDLANAQAFYQPDHRVFAMTVEGGALDIDFNSGQFATRLDLEHSLTGSVMFTASGDVNSNGHFFSRSNERVDGTISVSGSEAGYFFEKQLESGSISGLTLWDKR